MSLSFAADLHETRFCYLRGQTLRELLHTPRVLDALMVQLEVPGKAAVLQRLSDAEKIQSIESQIDHFRHSRTSVWYEVPAQEVLAASIFRTSSLPQRVVLDAWSAVKKEIDLRPVVARWINQKAFTPYAEVAIGTKRADVVGYRKEGFFSKAIALAVELKNEPGQLRRGLDQMTTFRDHVQGVYLACTPFLAATYLNNYADARPVKHWDGEVFRRKLVEFGFGLLLIERDTVHEVLAAVLHDPGEKRFSQVRNCVEALGAIAT